MQTRRQLIATSVAGLATAGFVQVSRARAQAVSKPVRIMVGFPAGGGTDMIARILAERLRGPYASTVLVENKAGASARLAAEYVKNAEPDGSVLLFTPDFTMTIYPHSFRALSYDPLRDFTPISPAARSMLTYSVGPAVPESVKTLADFVAWCKANPGKASYATTSAGGTPHFVGMMLASEARVPMTPVHYRGGAPALQDLLGGHVQASINPISETLPFARAGSLRVLAVTGSKRSGFLPDIPTMRGGRLRRGLRFLARPAGAGQDAGRDRQRVERGGRRGRQVAADDREPGEDRQRAGVPDAGGIRRNREGRHRALGAGREGVGLRRGGVRLLVPHARCAPAQLPPRHPGQREARQGSSFRSQRLGPGSRFARPG